MNFAFYLFSSIAIISALMMIIQTNAVHALLYLVISFLGVSLLIFTLGAPFIAALEVIIYAGAIIVLFIFVMLLLNLGSQSVELEKQWLRASGWVGPVILSLILLGELVYLLVSGGLHPVLNNVINPEQVGTAMFSTYLVGVELSSILLMASLVGAFHLGQRKRPENAHWQPATQKPITPVEKSNTPTNPPPSQEIRKEPQDG